ncbi:MAG: hypothetical protein GX589_04000, partial [Deltaproteobacteria bacterium]|nr:hypothetical protein [Deltaproteobacteria bacterium]
MQFISYLVDPALLQGDLPSKIVSTIIFLVVAVVLLGVGYYVLRLVASFFNPLSS